MADTKGEIAHQHLLEVAGESRQGPALGEKDAKDEQKKKRIASIDIFRGFTVAVISFFLALNIFKYLRVF